MALAIEKSLNLLSHHSIVLYTLRRPHLAPSVTNCTNTQSKLDLPHTHRACAISPSLMLVAIGKHFGFSIEPLEWPRLLIHDHSNAVECGGRRMTIPVKQIRCLAVALC